MITDACGNGISGVFAQGKDWRTVEELPSTQQRCTRLAGVETMLRHRDILQGTHFTWVTDRKSLEHVLTQQNLSWR